MTDDRQKINDLLRSFDIAMFTTRTRDGELHAHPLAVQEHEFDGDLWFIVGAESSTVEHLVKHSEVGVSFSDSSSWLSISGTAETIDDLDRLKELWSARVDAWFPDGPESGVATLVKVNASSAQYWDSPGKLATAISFVTSRITGESAGGSSGSVDLS